MEAILARLAEANISLLPVVELTHHFVFERDGFVAIVERRPDSTFGAIGTAGMLTAAGIAVLVGDSFVAKASKQAATAEQVESLRAFQSDLISALRVTIQS